MGNFSHILTGAKLHRIYHLAELIIFRIRKKYSVNIIFQCIYEPHNYRYEWKDYMSWNIIELTQNYVRYILNLIRENDPSEGILLHCISGTTTFPLLCFVKLLIQIGNWKRMGQNTVLCYSYSNIIMGRR